MEKIAVAKALKPQGIKGEIKFKVLLNNSESIKELKNFTLENRSVSVKSLRVDKDFAYIMFNEISSVVEADLVRNKMLFTTKEETDLAEGEYFIEDMIGKTCVFEDGQVLGEVTDIQNFGSADVYYVKQENGKEVLFSFVDGVIIDVTASEIVLNKKRFNEVSV